MPSWKKVIISGSNAALNTLTVSNGVTGSLFGTASWAVSSSNSQNAQDLLLYVKNVSGAQIDKGKVVRISGATGDNALITTASYENDGLSANTLGIVNQNIPNDSFGYVITEGTFIGFDTSTPGWTAGQLLYLGANGTITGSAPQAPLHAVRLGQVLRVQAINGSMYVRIDNGYEIGELHDVIDTSTTSSFGDLLVKSGSVWTNSRQLTGSYGLTGSLNATSFTGSFSGSHFGPLTGTASYASQALSASFSSTSSFLNSTTNAFIQNGNSFGTTALLGTNDNQSLAFETNGSTRMFISSSGNIGIGTTTPTVALQIGDTTSGTGNYIKVLGNNSDSTYDVFVGARRYPRFTLEDTTVGGSAFQMWSLGNTMRFGTNTGTTETSAWYTKAGNAADVIFNGKVGIGAISPSFRLSVSASSTSDGIQVIQSGTSRVELKGDGTAVWGSAADFGRLTWDTGKAILQGQSGKALSLGANNSSDHLYINTSANVGIGTTSPGAKLDVNGNTIITGSLAVSQSLLQYSNITAITSGSTSNVASFNTSSYTAAFFDYVTTSGTNARAGSVFTVWNGNSVEYTETSTNDIGSTSNLILSASVTAGAVRLQATSLSGSWSVKTLARML